jgi:hypothetical protein
MRRHNADGFRSRCVRWFRLIGLTLSGVLLVTASAHAGVLTATWTAPIANTDGSPLTDLALYRVYYSIFDSPCPGSTFAEVASPSSIPAANETISFQLTGLTAGAFYAVSVTAVDASGNESACSEVASATARDDSVTTTAAPDSTTTAPDSTTAPTAPDATTIAPDATTTPAAPDATTTQKGFCPPGQAKQGRC